jgi:hypothetical protein
MRRLRIDEALSTHSLARMVIDDAHPTLVSAAQELKAHVNRTGKTRIEKSVSTPVRYEYCVDVLLRVGAIIDTAERLEDCRVLLHRFPSPTVYRKEGIGHHT